ncbi:MAG: hypothetical protein JW768_09530 [Chitinispirillaceae bacterium]|nr:hypothetical protein [Chitinispirillaceae bacterium]
MKTAEFKGGISRPIHFPYFHISSVFKRKMRILYLDIGTSVPNTDTPDLTIDTPNLNTGTYDLNTDSLDLNISTPDLNTGTLYLTISAVDLSISTSDLNIGTPVMNISNLVMNSVIINYSIDYMQIPHRKGINPFHLSLHYHIEGGHPWPTQSTVQYQTVPGR